MFKPSKLSAIFIALCTSGLALNASAQSVDVKVIGTITPAACMPTITGGGVFNVGTIGADTLNQTAPTEVLNETRDLKITCDAPTKVALKVTDNRFDSKVVGIVPAANPDPDAHFGLGKAGSTNIGAMTITFPTTGVLADTKSVDAIDSADNGATWRYLPSVSPSVNARSNGRLITWSPAGTSTPVAFEDLSTTMQIRASVDRGANLPLHDEITLDGSATIELVYL